MNLRQLQPNSVDPSMMVSDIVRHDYRTADVFKQYGINYCCGGDVPLKEVCQQKGLKEADVNEALAKATLGIAMPNTLQFETWKLDFLIDYIVNIHHAYLRQVLPVLDTTLLSFIEGHKKKYPELKEVFVLFHELSETLLEHTKLEEESTFPYLKQIINTHRRKETYGGLFVKTFGKPLKEIVEKDHKNINLLLNELRTVTHNYAVPATACTNYQVIMQKLQELDNNIVQHKYLEDMILFPKAMAMEKELLEF